MGDTNFITLVITEDDAGQISFNVGVDGTYSGPVIQTITTPIFNEPRLTLVSTTVEFSDVRVWGVGLDDDELTRIYQFLWTSNTVALTHSGNICWVRTLGKGVKYAYKSLSHGRVTLDDLDEIDYLNEVNTQRYDDGRISSFIREAKVGLGGGKLPPQPWRLGQRDINAPIGGSIIVSNTTGNADGLSVEWLANNPSGTLTVPNENSIMES